MIRIGIIGLGQIGVAHLDALFRIPGVEVTAICGTDTTKLEDYQQKFKIAHIFSDWRALVSSEDVDAVHNCTPNHLHHEINMACIQAGKIIFSEKPLGMGVHETQEAMTVATEQAVPAGVNFCYRAYPMVQWARNLIQEGYLGEIRAIHGHYLQDWLMFDTDFNWRVDSKIGGFTRTVGDIGSHWVDIARYVTGLEIESVFSDFGTMLAKRVNPGSKEKVAVDTEDWAAVLLRFSNNVRGNMIVSQVNAGHKNDLELEVVGSKRSLRWRQEDPEHLWIGERGGINQLRYKDLEAFSEEVAWFASYPSGHSEGYADSVKNTIANFYRCVQVGSADYPTFADGHRVMEIVTAIAESAKRENWVDC